MPRCRGRASVKDKNEMHLQKATGKWFSGCQLFARRGVHLFDLTEVHIYPTWSAFTARVSNRLARHFSIVPLQLPDTGPMVSFTFDDVLKSAATVGAPMLEEYNGRGTFYVAGALTDQRDQHWA